MTNIESNNGSFEDIAKENEALKQQLAQLQSHERTLQERVHNLESQQSAQMKANQEIIRLERLRALEEMAQGVAHNFNNVLVGVLGYAQIIEMQSQEKQTISNARKIVENALRAKELVQRLNKSVREAGDLPLHRITTLDTIVHEAIKATQSYQKNAAARNIQITIHESLYPTLPIKGNPIELHHVLVHLLTNAIDAMPNGGEIAITTRTENNNLVLSVADQGIGMTDETSKRIFEPFFTTKQDVGSGLGLSMAYRTITGWGGHITVKSAPGQGSIFAVYLPIWNDDSPPVEPPARTHKARILVVDDEEAVHEVIQAALNMYDLTLCANSKQALEKFETGKYDLSLIDLQLPDLPGDELVQHLHKADPELICVLMTGWDVMQDDPRLNLFAFHLPKPFRISEMIDVVKQALAKKNMVYDR